MSFVTLGLFSCLQKVDFREQNTSSNTRTDRYCKKLKANMTLVKYLELSDDEYVLNISQSDAEKMGVPKEFYDEALSEVDKANAFIKEMQKDPNNELQLTDPKTATKVDPIWNQSTSYVGLGGTLRTSGQEEAMSPHVWAPIYTKGIEFLCRANAAVTPIYSCKTYSSGSIQSKRALGMLGFKTIVKVPLYVSNDWIRVSFQTTDSYGGTAAYSGYQ